MLLPVFLDPFTTHTKGSMEFNDRCLSNSSDDSQLGGHKYENTFGVCSNIY